MKFNKQIIYLNILIPSVLLAEHQELPSIIIEGSYDRPGSFSITPDSSGLKDTASLLGRVPGADVNRNGPLTGIASYRGLYGNRINITVDGANMKEVGPNSMDPPLSHIPAPLTGALKVQRGIAPVSSGIDTIGGAMVVESRKGEFADGEGVETNGMASLGYSSVEDGHYGVLLGAVATQDHKLYLSGSKEKGRDYRIKNNQKQVPTRYDRDAFTAGYGYQRDAHEFGINFSHNDTGHTGTPALPMDIIYVRGGLYDVNYAIDLGEGYKFKTRAFYQSMRHWMDNNTLRSAMMNMAMRTEVDGGGADLAFHMPVYNGELSLGINLDQSNHEANIFMGAMPIEINFFNNVERDRYSFYTEWNGRLSESVALELGARYTHTVLDSGLVSSPVAGQAADRNAFNAADRNRDFNDVDIAAVVRYAYSSNLEFEIGLARKNRAPTYQELYLWTNSAAAGGLADGFTYRGDLDLKNETAYQFELGAEWHNGQAYFAPRFFYHYIDDYIQGMPTAAANVLQFTNIEAQLFGVEIEGGISFCENWRFDANLNYVRGMQLDSDTDDEDLYRIAPLNGRAQLTYERSVWMGAIEGVFYADQGDVAGYNDELKTKGYMLMNLRGRYELVDGLVVGTGIENVLDEKHFNHLGGYQLHNRTNGRVAMQGRNIYATLGYTW